MNRQSSNRRIWLLAKQKEEENENNDTGGPPGEVLRGDKGGSGKYRDISGKPSWYLRASRNTRRY